VQGPLSHTAMGAAEELGAGKYFASVQPTSVVLVVAQASLRDVIVVIIVSCFFTKSAF